MSWIYEHRDDLARQAGRKREIATAVLTGVFTLGCFGLAAAGAYTLLSRQDVSDLAFFRSTGVQASESPLGAAEQPIAQAKAPEAPGHADGTLAAAEVQPDRNKLREPARLEGHRARFTELPRR